MDFVYVYLAGTATVLVGVIWFSYAHAKRRLIVSQGKGMIWLSVLRNFLAKIQKHRGMSTAYINGNHDVLPDIERLETAIAADIHEINNVDLWMSKNDQWVSLVEHWDRLKSAFKKNDDAENNLLQHNRMIQNILYLVEEMADEHSLLMLRGANQKNIEFLWKDLLHAIEFMGQARAIGSGIAAKKSCTSVERIRMNYLHKKIQENGLSIVGFLPQSELASSEITTMLAVIDEHLLGARCDIDSRDYFNLATKAIEFLYQQYDMLLAQAKAS